MASSTPSTPIKGGQQTDNNRQHTCQIFKRIQVNESFSMKLKTHKNFIRFYLLNTRDRIMVNVLATIMVNNKMFSQPVTMAHKLVSVNNAVMYIF